MSTHKKLSFIKSGVRLLGYAVGVGSSIYSTDPTAASFLFYAFVILIISEIIGVIEEVDE